METNEDLVLEDEESKPQQSRESLPSKIKRDVDMQDHEKIISEKIANHKNNEGCDQMMETLYFNGQRQSEYVRS